MKAQILNCLVIVCFSCLGAVAADRPNILLIVSEDNGPELGCYGDPHARTPNLDRLASEGVLFENAFVPYSVCSPSRASFLTGLYPHQNGQIGLATHKFAMYREQTPNFASILKKVGYTTGLIGKLHVNPESAFPFDFRAIPGPNFNRHETVANYAAEAAGFFAQTRDSSWFLSVNFPDAHLPFLRQANGLPTKPLSADEVKPLPWIGVNTPRLREQVANYYNCLERLDHGVGLLMAVLRNSGQAENTLVIYIGDHGAQFPRGKGTVYEGGLRIPMIIRWPAITKAGKTCRELVSTVDLLPTALQAARVEAPEDLPGRALQPLLSEPKVTEWRQYIFGFTTGSFPRNCFVQHSIRDKRYKLISSPRPGTVNLIAGSYLDESHQHFVISGATSKDQATASRTVRAAFTRWQRPPRFELYDLQKDPYEWHDQSQNPELVEVKRRLIKALTDQQEQTHDPFIDPKNVEAYVMEQLANRDLGYRRNKSFRWSYLDAFPKWRATHFSEH
jgi:N-sulfoglucosamine sulfohydrolase